MRKLIVTLLLMLSISKNGLGQKILNKPIELSFFYTLSMTYSKLTVTNPNFSSHPYFNASDYGIKIQRQLKSKDSTIFITGMLGGLDLSVSGKFAFNVSPDSLNTGLYLTGQTANKTILPHYVYVSTGLKKILKSKKHFDFNAEFGIRLFIKNQSAEPNYYDTFKLNGKKIYRQFTFEKSRKLTFVPYLATGIDYKIGRFKFGIQLWVQNSFINMYQYDYKVDYGTLHYETKIYTTGLSWGSNVYVKLFSF